MSADSTLAPPTGGRAPAAPVASPAAAPALGRAARWGLAVLAGGLLLLAPPPYDLWWAAPLGVAALTVAVGGVSLRRSWLLATVAHLALFLPLLEWTRFIGPAPWLALAVLQALLAGLVGPLTTLARRVLPLAALPVGIAGAWVAMEAVRGRVPYGGFTWGRLAFGQTEGPALGVAAVGGAPLVTAVTAASGAALLVLLHAVRRRRPGAGAAGALALLLPLLGLLVSPPPADRTLRVAAVQGNVPQTGLTGLGEDREVLANHVEQTLRLVEDVRAGRRAAPDLVVWPENAVDQDPRLDPPTAAALEDARRALGAPFVVGAVLRSGERLENSIFVWDGAVPDTRYAKQHLVPFGEYLPHRPLIERVFPAARSLLPRDFAPGDRVGTLDVAGVRLAVGTCYEVAFDDLPREAVRAGGEILVLPSNNASYGRSAESAQQLAMARLRAVEHGRAAVVATTSGISALVEPDGRVVARSGLFEPAVLDAELPLTRSLTPATRFGPAVEAALVALGLLALAGSARSTVTRVTSAARGGR